MTGARAELSTPVYYGSSSLRMNEVGRNCPSYKGSQMHRLHGGYADGSNFSIESSFVSGQRALDNAQYSLYLANKQVSRRMVEQNVDKQIRKQVREIRHPV